MSKTQSKMDEIKSNFDREIEAQFEQIKPKRLFDYLNSTFETEGKTCHQLNSLIFASNPVLSRFSCYRNNKETQIEYWSDWEERWNILL